MPTVPLLQEEFHTDQATVTWILTALLLSASVSNPILGRLGNAFGKRRMLVFGTAALAAGSLAAACAPDIRVMIAARVLQGVGGGTIPLSFAIVRDELDLERVPGALARISSMMAVGFAAALLSALAALLLPRRRTA